MEYIEFFFCNFWHWLGGLIYLAVVFSVPLFRVNIGKNKKDKED